MSFTITVNLFCTVPRVKLLKIVKTPGPEIIAVVKHKLLITLNLCNYC